ncbi:hypothetical protein GGR56DRAFT_698282 [Xylariaceae sp. FL0804]|nr:hypothetical protein GGR56DRAFT_698282 [Xylariaceae sp. FL0804]
MLYCTYCGKAFTRKEHLERHLPQHTNVKPHRCSACYADFSRRDMLQRHYNLYHEDRHTTDPQAGGVPTIAGRTPIACQNCAQAKTGCDKRVPCGRCKDKGLTTCEARYARRSSKAAKRAADAQAQTALKTSPPAPTPVMAPSTTVNPAFMDIDRKEPDPPIKTSLSPDFRTIDPRIAHHEPPYKKNSPTHSHMSSEDFSSPHTRMESIDEIMQLGSHDFMAPETMYQDVLSWQPGHWDFDVYSNNTIPMTHADMTMPMFAEPSDMSSSNSEHISSSGSSIHTRSTSIISRGDMDPPGKPVEASLSASPGSVVPEIEVITAAEASWPLARCNPLVYSGSCPRTAIVHLECLEQKSKQEGTWSALEQYLEQVDWDASDLSSVVPMTARTRDKMLAITQTFLAKALEIHRGGVHNQNQRYASPGLLTFLVLPPSQILEYFLRSYVRNLSFFYSLVSSGCVDPNDMIQNNQAATLLVLLMIAQGASVVPTTEARALSAGLIETCRISLFDMIEKDIEMCADPTVLRCALLFTLLGAWSGDKWLMDISMGQRGMYLAMLQHAGMFEAQSSMVPSLNISANPDFRWRSWLRRERQNRLVYNWVMVDQELSLFHDTAPMLAISSCHAPLPSPDLLWTSANAEQWVAAVQSVYGCTANVNPQLLTTPSLTPSLFDLFQDFLHDNLAHRPALTPYQLRLLLHPLQSLLCHLRQMLSCFSDALGSSSHQPIAVTQASTTARLDEVQVLLQRWYELNLACAEANPDPASAVSQTNFVLYHLIALNAAADFPEVERLARREGVSAAVFEGAASSPSASTNAAAAAWELMPRRRRCLPRRDEAVFHCAQVFRLVRAMPPDRRPSWWSAAVYRAALVLWADRLLSSPRLVVGATPSTSPTSSSGAGVGGDGMYPPVLLTQPDGSAVALDRPDEVLDHAVGVLEEGISTRIGDGIRRKLRALNQAWSREPGLVY